jgi:multidrug efflux pump subunit AcrA (membrane-fusion protein)
MRRKPVSTATYVRARESGEFRPVSVETPVIAKRSQRVVVPAERLPKRRSRKPLLWLAPAALVAVSAFYQPWKSASSETVPAGSSNDAVRTVKVDRPSPAATSSVVLPATLRPWQTTTLHARVSGYLKAWHHDLGARVQAGEVLAEIETPELDQELAEGKSLAREAAAAAVQAKAERTEAEADLEVAEAQLVRIQADKELVKSQLVRRKKLLPTGAISHEEFDTFSRQTEARTADVVAARADVARRRANLATRAAIIEVREATAKSRQAAVARLEELQIFKQIVAPFDGVVMRRTAEVGMLVTAGQESLYVLEDTSRVRVQVNVPQTYAMQTTPGVAAVINLPESAQPDVQGTVTRIAESVDAASRTMLAEIELDNSSHRLQPGSYAQVTLMVPQAGAVWTIPTNTLSMRVEGPHVAAVNQENRLSSSA